MYNLKFGCQSYPWKMEKHFGQLPRMLKVAAEAGIVCCFHPNSAKNSLFRTEEDYEAMFELIQPTAIGWAPDVGHIDYDYGTWSTGR